MAGARGAHTLEVCQSFRAFSGRGSLCGTDRTCWVLVLNRRFSVEGRCVEPIGRVGYSFLTDVFGWRVIVWDRSDVLGTRS